MISSRRSLGNATKYQYGREPWLIAGLFMLYKEKKMKKLVAITLTSLGLGAFVPAGACMINLKNDLNTPVTITSAQGEQTIVTPQGAITFGNPHKKADFTVTKDDQSYRLIQTACSENHLIDIKISEISTKNLPYFDIQKVDPTTMKSHKSVGSCCGN